MRGVQQPEQPQRGVEQIRCGLVDGYAANIIGRGLGARNIGAAHNLLQAIGVDCHAEPEKRRGLGSLGDLRQHRQLNRDHQIVSEAIAIDFIAERQALFALKHECETRLRRCMKELRRRCSPTEDQAIDRGGMLPIIGRVTRDDVHHLTIDCFAAVHDIVPANVILLRRKDSSVDTISAKSTRSRTSGANQRVDKAHSAIAE